MENRYQYYDSPDKIVCVTRFAGCTVKGTAKWVHLGPYDATYGRMLAKARCDEKVAVRRKAIAQKEFEDARRRYEAAYAYCDKMGKYLSDALKQESEAKNYTQTILTCCP